MNPSVVGPGGYETHFANTTHIQITHNSFALASTNSIRTHGWDMALMNQNTSIPGGPLKMAVKQSRDQTPSARNSPLTGMDLGGNVSTHLPSLFHSGWGSQHRNTRNLIIEKQGSRQMKARTQGMGCQGRQPGCANQDSRKEAVSAEIDWPSTTSALWRDWNVVGPEASYFISG